MGKTSEVSFSLDKNNKKNKRIARSLSSSGAATQHSVVRHQTAQDLFMWCHKGLGGSVKSLQAETWRCFSLWQEPRWVQIHARTYTPVQTEAKQAAYQTQWGKIKATVNSWDSARSCHVWYGDNMKRLFFLQKWGVKMQRDVLQRTLTEADMEWKASPRLGRKSHSQITPDLELLVWCLVFFWVFW